MDNVSNNNKINIKTNNKLYSKENKYPISEISINSSKIVKKKNKCHFCECKKKIKLTDIECKCGFKYCLKHRMPESHNCSFNYKEEAGKILSDKLMTQKTVSDKIVKI
mgnify:CR=1 FL=1